MLRRVVPLRAARGALASSGLVRASKAVLPSSVATSGGLWKRSFSSTPTRFNQKVHAHSHPRNKRLLLAAAGLTATALVLTQHSRKNKAEAAGEAVDYKAVRQEIEKILDEDDNYGPTFVRLAWHSSGTYDKTSNNGGSNGAGMRFQPEAGFAANYGLEVARYKLEKVKAEFPGISNADLWILAAVTSIEYMGGPPIAWRPGRVDFPSPKLCPPDGRLPDASKGTKENTIKHLRDIFYRMGFNDREIVALAGAHAIGRCHADRSGFDGPWTRSPTTFSNQYFKELLETKWEPRKWDGPEQFQDPTGDLMMLPADLALTWDPQFKQYVELYAKDEKVFFDDFGKAFTKLTELGVPFKK